MRALILLLTLLVTAAGCGQSPLGPSPVTVPVKRTVALTVQTRIYGGQAPLPGVSVTLESHLVGLTDAAGRLTFDVPAEREVLIGVGAVSYRPAEVWGTLAGPEIWTFYLEPVP